MDQMRLLVEGDRGVRIWPLVEDATQKGQQHGGLLVGVTYWALKGKVTDIYWWLLC